jgi:hypothetical protein
MSRNADTGGAETGDAETGPGAAARALIRRRAHAALATMLDGQPYVSMVARACDLDAAPLMFLSDLAQHTRNLRATPALSLLFEDTAGFPDPLAGPRLTLLGCAEPCADERAVARFMARHPAAAAYGGFADFHLYRVAIGRGHLVAGFGRIAWIEASELRFAGEWSKLAATEAEVVAHMNGDHAASLAAVAAYLLHRPGEGWRMTGIDPEGFDLGRGGETARVDFPAPVLTPAAAREALVALTRQARAAAGL